MSWSKEKRAEYKKNWDKENSEHVKNYRREYYLKSKLKKLRAAQSCNECQSNNNCEKAGHAENYRIVGGCMEFIPRTEETNEIVEN